MNRIQKLQALIDQRFEGSKAAFGRAIDRAPAQVSQWLSGHRKLGDAGVYNIEEKLKLPQGWFDDETACDLVPETTSTPPSAKCEVIHRWDAGGSMGSGIVLSQQPGVIDSWTVSQEWLRLNVRGYTSARKLAIVTGFGDSMRPLFNPGDPLLIDTSIRSVEYDGVYFFRVGDEGFIKRLQRIPPNGLLAMSENKAYRDWTIPQDMNFEVFGRVLKVWRSDDF